MNVEQVLFDFFKLAKWMGIEEKAGELFDVMKELVVNDSTNIVAYNTITANYTGKEQSILFYLWGRLTS